MNLLLENGQLLKPHALPWSPGGWVIPDGWTPERTTEMHGRFELLRADNPDAPAFLLWQQIEKDEGEYLHAARRPWPGWVMVPSPHSAKATKEDRRIGKAYKALFIEMNPQYEELVKAGKRPPGDVEWPPDGRYRLRNGKMENVR